MRNVMELKMCVFIRMMLVYLCVRWQMREKVQIIGVLAGTTGGYIIGFLFSALVMWAMEKLPGKKSVMQIVSMIVGLIVCYAFGTAWFMIVYSRANGAVGLATVLGWCVIPFIIPDIIKIVLAYGLSRKLRKFVA